MKQTTTMVMIVAILFTSSFFLQSCKKESDPVASTPVTKTLYERLGKVEAITAVVDKFLTNVASDTVINARFAGTVANTAKFNALRTNLINQIGQGAGGPQVYSGKTMLAAHTGMNISQAEFNALVGDLVGALDHFSVPTAEKNELLGILGPMQTDIVGK